MHYQVTCFNKTVGTSKYYGGLPWKCYAVSHLISEDTLTSETLVHAVAGGSTITVTEKDWDSLVSESTADPRFTAKMPDSFRPNLLGKTACRGSSKKAVG